jgi:hypothetical protein
MVRKMKAIPLRVLTVWALAFTLPGIYAKERPKDPPKVECVVQATSEEAERQLAQVRELAKEGLIDATYSRGFCAGLANDYGKKGRAADRELEKHRLSGKAEDPTVLHSVCLTHAKNYNFLRHHRCLMGQDWWRSSVFKSQR